MESPGTASVTLVHLVWAPLGPEALARFLDSYRHHPAGVEHRLLMVFNGFRADQTSRRGSVSSRA